MPKVDVQDPVKLERFAQLERESGPYIGYPRAKPFTAPRGDVNALPDPRTYAAVSGFLGTPTEEQGFSVFHPDLKNIRTAGDIGYGAGIAANLLPALGPAIKGTARLAGQALSDASRGQGYKALQNVVPQPMFAVPPSLPSASNVKDFNFETKPTTAPPSTPITTEQYNANLANFLKNSKEKGDWYHGTASDVTEFKPELGLEKPNQAGAAFFSKSPEYSGNKYAVDAPIYMAKEAHKHLTPEQIASSQEKAKQYFRDTYPDMPEHADSMIKSIEEGKPVGEAEDQIIEEYRKHLPSGPNVMKVHLNVENPFDPAVPEHVQALKEFNPNLDPKLTDRIGVTAVLEHPDIQEAIKGSGFDSFYTNEDGYRNIGVFDPTRIKSAIGNEGTFDPTTPVITKKDGGSVTVEDPVMIERKLELMGLI